MERAKEMLGWQKQCAYRLRSLSYSCGNAFTNSLAARTAAREAARPIARTSLFSFSLLASPMAFFIGSIIALPWSYS
jgi:hypothetical protein